MAATNCLCQNALNRKLSCKFKKWWTFSSHIKAKSCKTRSACTTNTVILILFIFTVIVLAWYKRNHLTLKLNVVVVQCYRTQLQCNLDVTMICIKFVEMLIGCSYDLKMNERHSFQNFLFTFN
jgi:hypothetical protein